MRRGICGVTAGDHETGRWGWYKVTFGALPVSEMRLGTIGHVPYRFCELGSVEFFNCHVDIATVLLSLVSVLAGIEVFLFLCRSDNNLWLTFLIL